MSDFPEGTIFIELRDVYDGWSIAHLPNGSLINRWHRIHGWRYETTQRYIDFAKASILSVSTDAENIAI